MTDNKNTNKQLDRQTEQDDHQHKSTKKNTKRFIKDLFMFMSLSFDLFVLFCFVLFSHFQKNEGKRTPFNISNGSGREMAHVHA